jgi:hypothetical protein
MHKNSEIGCLRRRQLAPLCYRPLGLGQRPFIVRRPARSQASPDAPKHAGGVLWKQHRSTA